MNFLTELNSSLNECDLKDKNALNFLDKQHIKETKMKMTE